MSTTVNIHSISDTDGKVLARALLARDVIGTPPFRDFAHYHSYECLSEKSAFAPSRYCHIFERVYVCSCINMPMHANACEYNYFLE